MAFDAAAAKRDAEVLRKAMKGLGTDDKTLIATITSRSNSELQAIRKAYQEAFNRDLIKDIKSETSGDYERVIAGLVYTPAEFDAKQCNSAMRGAGTDEDALIQVLTHRTPQEMEGVKAAYLDLFGKTLAHDLEGDTSGHVRKLFLALINSQRVEKPTDPDTINADIVALYNAGQGRLGTDEDKFIALITGAGPTYLRALNEEYARRHGDTLARAVSKEMGGVLGKALEAVMADHDDFYSDLIFKACDGAGTQDEVLIRAVVSRRGQLQGISKRFMAKYGKSLKGRVETEASGNYKKALLSVLEGY